MSKETKVSALKTPFSFLGYISSKIELNKTRTSNLVKLKVSCFNVNYSTDTFICSIGIRLNLDFNDSHENVLEYIADYLIRDESLQSELTISVDGPTEEKKKEIDPIVSAMVASVFPYIRQHLSAITSDSMKQITLPTLDIRRISLNSGLELTTQQSQNIKKKTTKEEH